MSDFRSILRESDFMVNVKKLYGWSDLLQSRWIEGMVSTLETKNDWRINNILEIDRSFGLNECAGGGLVLEAGFGTGALTIAAKSSGVNIIGIDYNHDYVTLARRLARAAGISDKEGFSALQQGNLEDLQFSDNVFSTIISHGVLHFVNDLVATARELIRVLKPGGVVYIDAADYRFPYEAQYNIPYIPFLKKDLAKAWVEGFEKPVKGLAHFRYISLPQCMGIFRAVGFDILQFGTSVPESRLQLEVDKVLMHNPLGDYLLNDPESIYLLARRVKEIGVETSGSALYMVCRKPTSKVFPCSF